MPKWMLTIITMIVIFWLTLAPKPLGEEPPQLFPGADKIVHALMFGFLVAMMLLDWQRKHGWTEVAWSKSISCFIISALTGILIELLQASMALGRAFEYNDILADTVGALMVALLWMPFQKMWSRL